MPATNVTPTSIQLAAEISAYDAPQLRATYDAARGIYTIGYGGTFEAITPGDTWTEEQALFHLQSLAASTLNTLADNIANFDSLSSTRQSAIAHAAIATGGPLSFISDNPDLVAAIEAEDFELAGELLASSTEASLGDIRANALAEALITDEQGAALPPLTAEQANSDLSRTANIVPDNQTPIETAVGELPDMGFPLPTPAAPSAAVKALWTNRVPAHEPWPRTLKCYPQKDPTGTQAYDDPTGMGYENVDVPERQDVNRHHINELSDDSAWVGRVEGNEFIERNPLWRR